MTDTLHSCESCPHVLPVSHTSTIIILSKADYAPLAKPTDQAPPSLILHPLSIEPVSLLLFPPLLLLRDVLDAPVRHGAVAALDYTIVDDTTVRVVAPHLNDGSLAQFLPRGLLRGALGSVGPFVFAGLTGGLPVNVRVRDKGAAI